MLFYLEEFTDAKRIINPLSFLIKKFKEMFSYILQVPFSVK